VLVAALLSCRKSDKLSVRKPENPIDAALSRADYATALRLAQSTNTPEAKFYSGRMYNESWGVKADLHTAIQYYQDAANAGYPRAKVFLAGAYSQGRGVNRDAVKATQLLQEASSQGDAQAKYLLMMMQANPNQQMTPADEARN
jgi:TPR repeat protein